MGKRIPEQRSKYTPREVCNVICGRTSEYLFRETTWKTVVTNCNCNPWKSVISKEMPEVIPEENPEKSPEGTSCGASTTIS